MLLKTIKFNRSTNTPVQYTDQTQSAM